MTIPAARKNPDRARKLEGFKEDFWARTLTPIPTTMGRLVHLASLRDARTALYRDPGLTGDSSEAEADALLRAAHEEVFGTWLSFSLEDQREDLAEYLASVKKENPSKLETWLAPAPYQKLIPASAEAAERELYRSDLEIVLDVVTSDCTQSKQPEGLPSG